MRGQQGDSLSIPPFSFPSCRRSACPLRVLHHHRKRFLPQGVFTGQKRKREERNWKHHWEALLELWIYFPGLLGGAGRTLLLHPQPSLTSLLVICLGRHGGG